MVFLIINNMFFSYEDMFFFVQKHVFLNERNNYNQGWEMKKKIRLVLSFYFFFCYHFLFRYFVSINLIVISFCFSFHCFFCYYFLFCYFFSIFGVKFNRYFVLFAIIDHNHLGNDLVIGYNSHLVRLLGYWLQLQTSIWTGLGSG